MSASDPQEKTIGSEIPKDVSPLTEYKRSVSPGLTLLGVSRYREQQKLTPFFALTPVKDLQPDIQRLIKQADGTPTEEDIVKAKASSVAVGLELARQLFAPKKISQAREDGRAGFADMVQPYKQFELLLTELETKNPDVALNELKRAVARNKSVQVEAVQDVDAKAFREVVQKAGQTITRKAEALRGYAP